MRRISAVSLAVLCLLSWTGCESPDDAKFTIGMSQSNLAEPWRAQMNEDLEKAAAKHPEIKVIYKNAEQDSLKQQAHVREFIERGVDVLIISPNEAAPLTAPVEEAMEAGIPVIVLDRAILSENYTCFIGADNVKIGRAAGGWLVEKLQGMGKVVELKGGMTSLPGQHRHQGFREAIEGTQIEVIFEPDTEWLEENARAEMVSALDRFPEIDAVYGHNDPAANGAYLAAKAAKREKEMLFVGIDALPKEGLQYVREGRLSAT
ncbi:MAG: substrate-binding domain-containing protein, partial [Planctomycetota bacterium]